MDTATVNPTAAVGNMANKIADALPDKGTVDRVAQTAHDAIDRVAAKAGPALEKVRATVSGTRESLKGKVDQLGDVQDQWLTTTRDYIRDNPLTAVAIGVVLGAVLAKLASSSSE